MTQHAVEEAQFLVRREGGMRMIQSIETEIGLLMYIHFLAAPH